MPRTAVSRRDFLAGSVALTTYAIGASAQAVELSEDGLHQQPWFLQSFLDLQEDLEAAQANGKTFAVLWELKGCPFCKLLHEENFANPTIADYSRQHFDFLQLNLIGARPVTDFDGTDIPENELAVRYGVRGTPTLIFFAEENGEAREVGRTQYLKPEPFYGMLRFIHEEGYRKVGFDEWLKDNPATL